jgi:hypothetical protein
MQMIAAHKRAAHGSEVGGGGGVVVGGSGQRTTVMGRENTEAGFGHPGSVLRSLAVTVYVPGTA